MTENYKKGDYSMRKLWIIAMMCVTMAIFTACSRGAGNQTEGNAEPSTELYHKYLESCDCPVDADGVKNHTADCDVPEISDKVELVSDMYTLNRITKDGYATYQYVITDAQYSGYFDEKNHINVLDDYAGLTDEVLAILAAKDNRPKNMLTGMYLGAVYGTKLTQDGMTILEFNENDPRQVAEKVKVKNMNSKNIRCLVQNYFIDKDGNVLSDKIADKYFDGEKALKLSSEQLEWAEKATEDTLNMEYMTYEEFLESYNSLTAEQLQVWNDIWGVEY